MKREEAKARRKLWQEGKRPLPVIQSNRSCGDCTACCTTLSVYELRKKEHVPCQHVCEQGCGIYPDRPPSCKTFRCLWLDGAIPGDPPSKSGLIFYANELPIGKVIQVVEVWEDAADRHQELLANLSGKYLVQLVRRDGEAVWLPDNVSFKLVPQSQFWDTPLWEQFENGDPAFFSNFERTYA